MKKFTVVLPNQTSMPPELSLLSAPVCAAEPSVPCEHVGRTEGALLDENGHVVAFILRLATKLAPVGARTLIPRSALRIEAGPILHLSWTEDQVRAQPRLDENFQPHNRVDGGPPVESQWLPARPNVVPPAEGPNGQEAVKEGVEGGIIGAAIGAVAGFAVGGPLLAASLAAFFAAGGGLAGILSGVAQGTAADASELKFDPAGKEDDPSLAVPLTSLEQRLLDTTLTTSGVVTMTRIVPQTTDVIPPEGQTAVPAAQPANQMVEPYRRAS
jgi:hypothetical protein